MWVYLAPSSDAFLLAGDASCPGVDLSGWSSLRTLFLVTCSTRRDEIPCQVLSMSLHQGVWKGRGWGECEHQIPFTLSPSEAADEHLQLLEPDGAESLERCLSEQPRLRPGTPLL